VTYDAAQTAAFFDDYGEREWTRFDDGRTPAPSLTTHLEHLRRFVRRGERVLDAGAGPGRFTIALAELGARVTVADVSPGQLELNRAKVEEAGLGEAVEARVEADVLSLPFDDAEFDATVCFGGPISYVFDRGGDAVAELFRVTRPGGHVLVSVMSLVGTIVHFFPQLLDLVRRDGAQLNEEIVRTGLLRQGEGYGHLPMKLYRWEELESLLSPHGRIVAAAATGLLPATDLDEPELREFVELVERELATDAGAVGCGTHVLAVVEKPA
jgi:ubiquinone/menaquinone biosynthesis C-methylase UbiE